MARPAMLAPTPVGSGGGTRARFAEPGMPAVDNSTARGVIQFTQKSDELADAELGYQRISKLATATSDFQSALDKKRLELDGDPDIAGREAKFQKFSQEKFAEVRDGMDRRTGALFDRAGTQVADSMNMAVRHGAAKEMKDTAIVQLNTTNEGLVTRAGDARNPNERAAIVGQIDANLKQAVETNVLSPAQYETAKRNSLVKVDQAEALRLIRDNPGGMQTMLTKSDFLPNLDAVQRQNLIDKAGSEVLRRANLAYTAEARREIVERRALAKMGDDAMKEIIDLSDRGTLTDVQVEERRPMLKSDDYRAAKALLRGGAATDDINTLAVLAPVLGDRDVKNELTNALMARKITRETYNSYLSKNEQLLKDDQPASPYKRGREQIVEGLRPGALLSGPAADIQKQAMVNALREYDDFATRVGPQKMRESSAEAIDAAAEIRNRYRIVNFDKIGEAIGLPRFVAGNRETVSLDDLSQAGRKVLEELDRGALSQVEADRELKRLELWEQILTDRNAALEARSKNPPKPKTQGGDK